MLGLNTKEPVPRWHRWVYALAALPFLLVALMGVEYGFSLRFFVPALGCLGLALWPIRLGAAVLFWPFVAGFIYCVGLILQYFWAILTRASTPHDDADAIFWAVSAAVMAGFAAQLLEMWRPGIFSRIRDRYLG